MDVIKLVNLSKQGNREAFCELIKLYDKKVYLYMLKKTKDEELSREITQVAWIKAWKKIKRFQKKSTFSTWICKIAVNHFYDHYRKNKRYVYTEDLKVVHTGESDRDEYFWMKDHTPVHYKTSESPQGLRKLCLRELKTEIGKAMNKLSDDHKEVLTLSVCDELEYEQIADKLGCPVGTVMSRIFYARQKMRKELGEIKNEFAI